MHFYVDLPASSNAKSMAVNSCAYTVPALATAALVDSSLAAQTY